MQKFAALSDAVVGDWHRKGWLGLVHWHLASLEHFKTLLNRQAARAVPPASSEADTTPPSETHTVEA